MSEPIDAAAFSALYRETSVDLLSFLLHGCRTADDAADCLGETDLRARARIRSLLAGSDAEPGRETLQLTAGEAEAGRGQRRSRARRARRCSGVVQTTTATSASSTSHGTAVRSALGEYA